MNFSSWLKNFFIPNKSLSEQSRKNLYRGLGLFLGLFVFLFSASHAFAAQEASEAHHFTQTLMVITIILLAAKLSSLIERLGQPAVLGELVVGVVLGNIVLLGVHFFESAKTDQVITFLAELGVVILLFQIGLESQLKEMMKVGTQALAVAVIGVVAPFLLGTFVVAPALLPGSSPNTYLFLGAALTATSVGITARVFRDLRKLATPEAKIVLGAAVIDDILGLMILAVVSAIVAVGSVSVLGVVAIVSKAFLFLVGSIYLGQLTAPFLGKWLSRIHTGTGMKFTLALSFCLLFAFFAQSIGLAAIVGAFAAGLVLDPVHFSFFKSPKVVEDIENTLKKVNIRVRKELSTIAQSHNHKHVEDLIEPLSFFLVPIFFVVTGMQVNLATLTNPAILAIALAVTLVAVVGKVIAGVAAGKTNKLLVGFGMVPRGEVGLIFANIGKGLGVVPDNVFSIIVIMVILTTLMTPPVLTFFLRKPLGEKSLGLKYS